MKFLLLSILLTAQFAIATPREIVLTEANAVVLSGFVNPGNLASVLSSLFALDQNLPAGEKGYLVIYTNGGMVQNCEEFSDGLAALDRIDIVVLKARSAGALISQCSKRAVRIDIAGDLMFHKIRTMMNGIATVKQLEEFIKQMKEHSVKFDNLCRTRMKLTAEEYDKKTDDADWFLKPKEAVDVKAADEIVKVRCSPEYEKKSPVVVDTDLPGDVMLSICQVIKNLHANQGSKHGPHGN